MTMGLRCTRESMTRGEAMAGAVFDGHTTGVLVTDGMVAMLIVCHPEILSEHRLRR